MYYSGTVAAAREAAILGCRAFAVSSYMRQDVPLDWDEQTEIAATTIESLLGLPTDAGQFWNVNFPAVPAGETPGPLLFTRQSTEPQTVAYEPAAEASRAYRFSGDYSRRPANQEADVRAVFAGHVSATLLQLDTSVHVPHQLSTDQTGASPANQD